MERWYLVLKVFWSNEGIFMVLFTWGSIFKVSFVTFQFVEGLFRGTDTLSKG